MKNLKGSVHFVLLINCERLSIKILWIGSSSIFVGEEIIHVVYLGEGKGLMIIAFPECK